MSTIYSFIISAENLSPPIPADTMKPSQWAANTIIAIGNRNKPVFKEKRQLSNSLIQLIDQPTPNVTA